MSFGHIQGYLHLLPYLFSGSAVQFGYNLVFTRNQIEKDLISQWLNKFNFYFNGVINARLWIILSVMEVFRAYPEGDFLPSYEEMALLN